MARRVRAGWFGNETTLGHGPHTPVSQSAFAEASQSVFAEACGGGILRIPQRARPPSNEESVSMPQIRIKENEPFDVALRRFKRACEKAGVLTEVRRREYHEKPTSIRKRKAAAAVKRHLKKLQREQIRRTRLY